MTIVFSGVGKQRDELLAALDAGILQFNCESEEELVQLSSLALSRGVRAPVALRVNPQIHAKTHPYIATALATSKFGVPAARIRKAYALASTLQGLRLVGLACHIGSQIGEVRPFVQAAEKMRALFVSLRRAGHPLSHLDLGGGLGVPYGDGPVPAAPDVYGRALAGALRGLDAKILFEPGRLVVANAGLLLSRVILTKRGAGARKFVVIDAGKNDLLRPALYQAHHAPFPIVGGEGKIGIDANKHRALHRCREAGGVHRHGRSREERCGESCRRPDLIEECLFPGGVVRNRATARRTLCGAGKGEGEQRGGNLKPCDVCLGHPSNFARRRVARYSAVVGSMTVAISMTRLAGKPPCRACSRIIASFGARYTQ